MIRTALFAVLTLTATPSFAYDTTWAYIQENLFETRALNAATDHITIDVPYRTPNDLRTDVGATVTAPQGKLIGKIWVVLDENPMPVSAVFDFDIPQSSFEFSTTMRVNQQTPVHVVMETTDSQLYVQEAVIKTSGTGACSAPPGTDPELALATLGDMDLSIDAPSGNALAKLTSQDLALTVDMSHPSHSGMQKDQISLLFIPMRYVYEVDLDLDGMDFATMTGSISLSENPSLRVSIPRSTQQVSATLTDTEGAVSTAGTLVQGY